MNVSILIDSTVRQVTVLLAQLATSGGIRAPLANVANQVFIELARELEAQGVSRKVSADMFGMALRAYIRKVHRLAEGETETGTTLWGAVLDYIRSEQMVTRARVMERFKRDGDLEVSSILKDLSHNGLVLTSGSGASAVYRIATEDDMGRFSRLTPDQGIDELVWVLVFRNGPLTLPQLAEQISRSDDETRVIVDRLVEMGRVDADGSLLSARDFVIPLESELGWEASVFDHLQAMVQTICQRLRGGIGGSGPQAAVGGSTYTFDVWPGHPLYEEVRGQLAGHRARLGDLRARVDEANRDWERPDRVEQLVAYVGQCILMREEGESETHESSNEEG
jgi:hypothetical protein